MKGYLALVAVDPDFGEKFAGNAIPQILAIASVFVLLTVLQLKRKRQFTEMWETIVIFCFIWTVFINLAVFTSFGSVLMGWFGIK